MGRLLWIHALIFTFLFLVSGNTDAQNLFKKKNQVDTVYARAGQYVIMADTDFIALKDTIFLSSSNNRVKVKNNPYAKSDAFYDSLKVKSYRSKVTQQLYGLLIRNQSTTVSDSINVIESVKVFEPFEGDTIRHILLKRVDILEGSVYDTTIVIETGLGKALNKIHSNTREKIILQNLLFDVGEKVDPYQLADNERILRRIPFIDDALIEVIPPLNDEGYVDVMVITQDLFSWGLDGSLSSLTDWRIALFNRNIFGRGDELLFQYRMDDKEDPESGGLARLRINNLYGSFINAQVKYQNDFEEESFTFDFTRDFLTPETKYAGGLNFGDLRSYVDGRTAFDTVSIRDKKLPFSKTFYDFWIGRSFQINKNNERQTLILTARLLRENYSERPPIDENTNLAFQDKYLFMTGISFNKRNYYKSNMIFNFGRTEDIPIGYIFGATLGYEQGEFKDRPYVGTRLSGGHYFEHFGYFSAGMAVGGFIEDEEFQQGTFQIRGLYFTPLIKLNRTKLRQFLIFDYTVGLKRDSIDLLSLRKFTRGVNGGRFRGDERLSFNYEADFFTPVYFYGFKLVAFPFADFGWLAYNEKLFLKDNFYYGFGFGVRLRNEGFIIRTIGISLSYYPQIVEDSPSFDVKFFATDPTLFRSFDAVKPTVIDIK